MIKTNKAVILWFFALLLPASTFAHAGDEDSLGHIDDGMEQMMGAEQMMQSDLNMMHYGTIKFPTWTYYVEIVLHMLSLAVAAFAVILIYTKLYKTHGHIKRVLDFAWWGFLLLATGELLTTLHHFLFYPFGIFNAIINHTLTLTGIGLIVYALFILRKQ